MAPLQVPVCETLLDSISLTSAISLTLAHAALYNLPSCKLLVLTSVILDYPALLERGYQVFRLSKSEALTLVLPLAIVTCIIPAPGAPTAPPSNSPEARQFSEPILAALSILDSDCKNHRILSGYSALKIFANLVLLAVGNRQASSTTPCAAGKPAGRRRKTGRLRALARATLPGGRFAGFPAPPFGKGTDK